MGHVPPSHSTITLKNMNVYTISAYRLSSWDGWGHDEEESWNEVHVYRALLGVYGALLGI